MVSQDDKFRVLRKLPEVRFEEELRGYSKSQVDRVLQGLAPLADDVASLQQRLAESEARAAGAEARLVEARSAEAAAPAAAVAPPAPPAPAAPANFDETLSKTLLLAQRTADQTVADAEAEAERLVADARAEAASLQKENAQARSEASAAVASERQSLLEAAHADVQAKIEAAEASLADAEVAQRNALVAEIAEYRDLRDELLADTERLEGHLAQRRETIRAALADIAVVVDDPGRLHSEMPPVADEPVKVPSTSEAGVILDVDGLDDLLGDPSASDNVDAPAQAESTVVGEDPRDIGEPTAAVPMVELMADYDDDAPVGEPTALVEAVVIDSSSVFDQAQAGSAEGNGSAPEWEHDANASDIDPAAVVVDELQWDDTSGAKASPADFGFEEASDHVPGGRGRIEEDLSRPAWADAVPDIEQPQVATASEDPFLDELRRATGDDAETDVALERFLSDNPDGSDEDRRSGWFNRRK